MGETTILHKVPAKACLVRDQKGRKGLVMLRSGGKCSHESRCKGPGQGVCLFLRKGKESDKGGACGWSGLSHRPDHTEPCGLWQDPGCCSEGNGEPCEHFEQGSDMN